MSIGPMGGIPASAAGAPLAQTKGSESERAQESTAQQRRTKTDAKAEAAAGIGETSEDQESSDRDADGRRLWEHKEQDEETEQDDNITETEEGVSSPRQVKDVHGESGNELDLTG